MRNEFISFFFSLDRVLNLPYLLKKRYEKSRSGTLVLFHFINVFFSSQSVKIMEPDKEKNNKIIIVACVI